MKLQINFIIESINGRFSDSFYIHVKKNDKITKKYVNTIIVKKYKQLFEDFNINVFNSHLFLDVSRLHDGLWYDIELN